jgi:hypothetical protein
VPEDDQFAELKRSYQVLGVPTDAAPPSIKHAYWQLVRRWHPDLYANGTPDHIEATQMAGLINEAYAAIAHAPLRNHIGAYAVPRRVAVPENAYEEDWRRYRARRNKIFLILPVALFVSFSFGSYIVYADRHFGSTAAFILIMTTMISFLVVLVSALLLLPKFSCPRCHNNFFGTRFGPFNGGPVLNWYRQSCAYCDLPRGD